MRSSLSVIFIYRVNSLSISFSRLSFRIDRTGITSENRYIDPNGRYTRTYDAFWNAATGVVVRRPLRCSIIRIVPSVVQCSIVISYYRSYLVVFLFFFFFVVPSIIVYLLFNICSIIHLYSSDFAVCIPISRWKKKNDPACTRITYIRSYFSLFFRWSLVLNAVSPLLQTLLFIDIIVPI